MQIDISHVLVSEHRRRLREAAQAPPNRVVARVWAIFRRRTEPESVVSLSVEELEHLAA